MKGYDTSSFTSLKTAHSPSLVLVPFFCCQLHNSFFSSQALASTMLEVYFTFVEIQGFYAMIHLLYIFLRSVQKTELIKTHTSELKICSVDSSLKVDADTSYIIVRTGQLLTVLFRMPIFIIQRLNNFFFLIRFDRRNILVLCLTLC